MPFPLKLMIGLILFSLINIPVDTLAVHPGKSSDEISKTKEHTPATKKELRQMRKAFRKALKPASSGIFSNQKFKWGLLTLGFGVGLSLLSLLLTGLGFLGIIGVIGIVAGVVLVVWGILEFIA